ncbi:MAG: hypothetical protein KGY70_20235 [Bacteroidales bacterium]|nr:hypothetical protein [Bacteroidales bacterium]
METGKTKHPFRIKSKIPRLGFHIRSIALLVLIGLSSCTDFFVDVSLQKEWEEMESENIVIHYRPEGFSASPSPDENAVQTMLENQNYYYHAIQDSIQRSFSDKVLIYIYNKDEGKSLIGTDGGGHAIPKLNSFYYTYLPDRRKLTDQYQKKNPPLGAHELVHVITHRTLGYPPTKMMSEGYAVWLDGDYGGYAIDDIIRKYRDDQPDKIMKTSELLKESTNEESVYYPNAGVFVRYLVRTYGVEKVNQLFVSDEDAFQKDFEKITGDKWKTMADEYTGYINNL